MINVPLLLRVGEQGLENYFRLFSGKLGGNSFLSLAEGKGKKNAI